MDKGREYVIKNPEIVKALRLKDYTDESVLEILHFIFENSDIDSQYINIDEGILKINDIEVEINDFIVKYSDQSVLDVLSPGVFADRYKLKE